MSLSKPQPFHVHWLRSATLRVATQSLGMAGVVLAGVTVVLGSGGNGAFTMASSQPTHRLCSLSSASHVAKRGTGWERSEGGKTTSGCRQLVGVGRLAVLVVVFLRWDHLVGEESVGAIVEHGFCELLHDGLGLEMQVPHHGIAMPATEHLNEILVDFPTQERHGAACADGTSAELVSSDSSDVVIEGGRSFYDVGDVFGCDGHTSVVAVVCCKGCGWTGA